MHRVETGRRPLRPVAPSLEGVGGQGRGADPGEEHRPVDLHPVGVEGSERGDDRVRLVGARPLGGDEHGLVPDGLGHREQDAVRPDLQEPPGVHGQHGRAEADRLANLAHPVPRVGPHVLGRSTGHRGHGRDVRLREGQIGHDRAELVQHRVHERGVERVADREPLGPMALRGIPVGGGQHRFGRAGDHHRPRSVDRCEVDPVGQVELVLADGDRGHGPALGQRAHERAAGDDHPARVGQGQHPGDVGGGDLADRVPGDDVRRHAPRGEQARQGDLDGEQAGLGELGAVDATVPAGQHVPHGVGEVGEHLVPRLGERRERGGESQAHPGALRALPGEQERGAARSGDDPGGPLQSRAELVHGRPGDHRPVVQVGTAECQRRPDGGGLGVDRPQPLGLRPQRLGGRTGEHPRNRPVECGTRALVLGRSLFDDHVRIGAAEPEGRDAGTQRPVTAVPLDGVGQQSHRAAVPGDVRGGLGGVQGPRKHSVAQGEHHLDDSGDTRGGLGVTDVGLDRPQPQRPLPVPAVGGPQRLGLDRVTEDGSGPVRLNGVHIGWFKPGGGQGGTDDSLLGRPVRRGQAVGRAVGVHRGPGHDRQDGVPVALSVGEPFDGEHADPLAPAGAVGLGGERLAPAVGGEPALAGELDEGTGRGHDGDTPGQRQITLAGAQCLHRPVQGDE